jgi:hypothetical protein
VLVVARVDLPLQRPRVSLDNSALSEHDRIVSGTGVAEMVKARPTIENWIGESLVTVADEGAVLVVIAPPPLARRCAARTELISLCRRAILGRTLSRFGKEQGTERASFAPLWRSGPKQVHATAERVDREMGRLGIRRGTSFVAHAIRRRWFWLRALLRGASLLEGGRGNCWCCLSSVRRRTAFGVGRLFRVPSTEVRALSKAFELLAEFAQPISIVGPAHITRRR